MTLPASFPFTSLSSPLPAGVRLRLAALEDGPALHRVCYPERSQQQFSHNFQRVIQWQSAGRSCVLVAEKDGQPVGSGQLIRHAGYAEIANLAVAADCRSQGIGTALVHCLTAVARQWGISWLEIGVAAGNGRALALYQRLGFEEDRRLRTPIAGLMIILGKQL
ncbi:MAG: GNAT family N-acetyltransferase [Chloroflexi bacterium]|nr:GNAT family N-acetyltransferase [Chloroflexota bacterium]MCI0580910.1 GNAT family N-acetyltransferase [Chloroflexota bacterium]MCI0725497.1 GNAT family N-acetyltransferase [Chloroflexota bacterium]